MKAKFVSASIAIATTLVGQVGAQIYDTNGAQVQTSVGSGFAGYLDGVGEQTMFNRPTQIVADSYANLFVWDWFNGRIRKVTPDGVVSTFAQPQDPGNPTPTYSGAVVAMAIDRSDTIFIGFTSSDVNLRNSLFSITSAGTVTQFATSSAPFLPFGGGIKGICADSVGNLYVALGSAGPYASKNQIYRLGTNNIWTVFAGSGNQGHADGSGLFSSFYGPAALAVDAADNIYVWDSGNNLIRKIDQGQNVTTFAGKYGVTSNIDGAGTNAAFRNLYQMQFDNSANLILGCAGNFLGDGLSIRKVSAATNVATIAGSFSQSGYTNGVGSLARFGSLGGGVCVYGGTIYVADAGNHRIRSITDNLAAPATLHLSLNPSVGFVLHIAGTAGRKYRVESSLDTTNWTTNATVFLGTSPYLWSDVEPVTGSKFYRAFLLP